MPRLEGISDADAGFVTSQVYREAKRQMGTVPDPLRLMAHSKSVMFAVAGFGLAFGKGKNLDPVLSDLCQLKVASMVGCLF